jgi:hypothetical protein
MIFTGRARSLVPWCDGEQNKISMQEPTVKISGRKIGNSGQEGRNGEVSRADRRA